MLPVGSYATHKDERSKIEAGERGETAREPDKSPLGRWERIRENYGVHYLRRLFPYGIRSQLLVPDFSLGDQTSQPSAHDSMHPMRAFMAPSLLLSIARRSNGLLQNFGLISATIGAGYPRTCCAKAAPGGGVSVVARNTTADMITAGPGAASLGQGAATAHRSNEAWPLGLNPDKCKVTEIQEQIRRRCGGAAFCYV